MQLCHKNIAAAIETRGRERRGKFAQRFCPPIGCGNIRGCLLGLHCKAVLVHLDRRKCSKKRLVGVFDQAFPSGIYVDFELVFENFFAEPLENGVRLFERKNTDLRVAARTGLTRSTVVLPSQAQSIGRQLELRAINLIGVVPRRHFFSRKIQQVLGSRRFGAESRNDIVQCNGTVLRLMHAAHEFAQEHRRFAFVEGELHCAQYCPLERLVRKLETRLRVVNRFTCEHRERFGIDVFVVIDRNAIQCHQREPCGLTFDRFKLCILRIGRNNKALFDLFRLRFVDPQIL